MCVRLRYFTGDGDVVYVAHFGSVYAIFKVYTTFYNIYYLFFSKYDIYYHF